jgi:hypothetical protein
VGVCISENRAFAAFDYSGEMVNFLQFLANLFTPSMII